MTEIKLYGLLGRIFGTSFKMYVNSAISVIKAIEANREGFIKKLYDLNADGYNYYIIINGKQINNKDEFIEKRNIEYIEIIPAICGSGGAIVTAIAGAAFAKTTAGLIAAFIVNMAISTAISTGVSFIMASLNKQAAPPPQKGSYISVGGATAIAEAKGRSYIFSNYQNTVAQGVAVPVGYGRMKISSKVIIAATKDYPVSYRFEDETTINQSQSIFSSYLAF